MKSYRANGAALSVIAACLATGGLSGCNPTSNAQTAPAPSAALPLAMDATAEPIAPAPAVSALPPAAPVRVAKLADPGDYYAYADQASEANRAFGDAPPDYAIDYQGTRPWVWRGDDQSSRVAEPLPGGGYRYYYYQPGAQYPYLVRDPEYTYGYDSGALVVVYDRNGQVVSNYQDRDRVDAASRILARAALLYAASQQMQHQAVYAANWQARQDRIAEDNAHWRQAQTQQRAWAAYHAAHQQQEAEQWGDERYRREAQAARFAQQTNRPDIAQRDWQAAQKAHAQAPGSAPGPFGLHLGGPKSPPAPPKASAPPPGPPQGQPAAPPPGLGGNAHPGPGGGPDHGPGGPGTDHPKPGPDKGVRTPPAGPANTPAGANPAPPNGPGNDRHDHKRGAQGAGPGAMTPGSGAADAAPPVGAKPPKAPKQPAAAPGGQSLPPAPKPPAKDRADRPAAGGLDHKAPPAMPAGVPAHAAAPPKPAAPPAKVVKVVPKQPGATRPVVDKPKKDDANPQP